MVCFSETRLVPLIHRDECAGRHLVLIKMAFGCWHKSGLLHRQTPKIDCVEVLHERLNNEIYLLPSQTVLPVIYIRPKFWD